MADEDEAADEGLVHLREGKVHGAVHEAILRDAPEEPQRDSPLENAARRPDSQPKPIAACDIHSVPFADLLAHVQVCRIGISAVPRRLQPLWPLREVVQGSLDLA